MFIGPKLSTVFASRWKALAWSGGVLLTAYCSIPSPDADNTDSSVIDPAVSVVAGLMGSKAPAQAESRTSPWAAPSPTP